ncbi:MAG: hypothetical protein ACRCXZ_09355, partial [Patescibacteria group bacterium]
ATNSKIFLGEFDITNTYDSKNDTYSIKLNPDQNNLKLYAKNDFGNKSNVIDLKINNYTEGWSKFECKDLIFGFDASKLQLGFSGVKDQPNPNPEVFETNKIDCLETENLLGSFGALIYPKGTLANCWNCDGNSNFINIGLESSPHNLPDPSLTSITDKDQEKYNEIYKAKTGMSWFLEKDKKDDFIIKANLIHQGRNYFLDNLTKNFALTDDKEKLKANQELFQQILDSTYIKSLPNNTIITNSKNTQKKYISPEYSTSFDYPGDWKVVSNLIKKDKFSNVLNQNYIKLSKGGYEMDIRIQKKEDNPSNSGGVLLNDIESSLFSDFKIQDIAIKVPKLELLSPNVGYGSNYQAIIADKSSTAQNAYNFDIPINNKVLNVSFYYNGINYSVDNNGVKRGAESSIEQSTKNELFEILKSIKVE